MKTETNNIKSGRPSPGIDSIWPVMIEVVIYAFLILEMWSLWLVPTPADFPRIQTLAILMGFEFILVHSALCMNLMPRRVSLIFILPVYGIVAWFMNTGAENNLILYLYLGVMVTRLRFLFAPQNKAQKSRALKISMVSGLIYFMAIAIIAVGETGLPRGGLTSEFLELSNYLDSLDVYGIFTEQPHLPLLMGMFYFSALIIFDLYLLFMPQSRVGESS